MFLVALGDAFSGIRLFGLFKESDDASAWAEQNANGEVWNIVSFEAA